MLLFFISVPTIIALIGFLTPIFTFVYYSVTLGGWAWKFFNWVKKRFNYASEEEKQLAEFYEEDIKDRAQIKQEEYESARNFLTSNYPKLRGKANGNLLIIKRNIIEVFGDKREGKRLYLAVKNLYANVENKEKKNEIDKEAHDKIASWFVGAGSNKDVAVYYLQYVISRGIDINKLSFSPERFNKFNEIFDIMSANDSSLNKKILAERYFKLVLVLGTDFVNTVSSEDLIKIISSEHLISEFDSAFDKQLKENKDKFCSKNENRQKKDAVTATKNSMKLWFLCHSRYDGYEAKQKYGQAVELCSMHDNNFLVRIDDKTIHSVFDLSTDIMNSEDLRLKFSQTGNVSFTDFKESLTREDKKNKYGFEVITPEKFKQDLGNTDITFSEDVNGTLKYNIISSIGNRRATNETRRIYLQLKNLPESQKENISVCFKNFPAIASVICRNYNRFGGAKRSFTIFEPERVECIDKVCSGNKDVSTVLRVDECIGLFGIEFVDKFKKEISVLASDKKLWNEFCQMRKKTSTHRSVCPSAYRNELKFWALFFACRNKKERSERQKEIENARKVFDSIFSNARPYLFSQIKHDQIKSMADNLRERENIEKEIYHNDKTEVAEKNSIFKRTITRSKSYPNLAGLEQTKIK